MSGDLSTHFSRAEFRCRCGRCGHDTVDAELLTVLEAVREHFGAKVRITSACRCADHNARVGGSPRSQHVRGRAADIQVEGVAPAEVYAYLVHTWPDRYGFGQYQRSGFVHVDTRTSPARWSE